MTIDAVTDDPVCLKVVEVWVANQVPMRLNSGGEIFNIPGPIEVTFELIK